MFTKKEKVIILMILIVLGFGFYWYSARPYLAKKDCVEYAEKFSRSSSNQSFEELYDHCILKKGLK